MYEIFKTLQNYTTRGGDDIAVEDFSNTIYPHHFLTNQIVDLHNHFSDTIRARYKLPTLYLSKNYLCHESVQRFNTCAAFIRNNMLYINDKILFRKDIIDIISQNGKLTEEEIVNNLIEFIISREKFEFNDG